MIFENFKLAFRSLTSNRLRTFLSLLGIVIGVASVIAITSLGASAGKNITDSIAAAGLETMTVFPAGFSREVRDQFTEELGEAIQTFIPGVDRVFPQHSSNARTRMRDETWNGTAYAVLDAYAQALDYQVEYGRFINADDLAARRSVLVLGAEAAKDLFPDDPSQAVGTRLRVVSGGQTRVFEVIGVMKPKSAGFGLNYDDSAYLPYTTYTQRFTRTTNVGSYLIKIQSGEDPMAVTRQVEEYLNTILGSSNFRLLSPATIAETANEVTQTFGLFLSGIAAISLLVGGIGIMNIMLVAVVERTREIGIRKALGARQGVILGQFLIEAGVLTTIGGVLGVGAGFGISSAVANILGFGLVLNLGAAGLAVGISAGIGIFFGLYPAYRASRLDPIAALSHE